MYGNGVDYSPNDLGQDEPGPVVDWANEDDPDALAAHWAGCLKRPSLYERMVLERTSADEYLSEQEFQKLYF